VEGDLLSQSLAIEEGAYFDGKSCRSGDPLSTRNALAKDEIAKLESASASAMVQDKTIAQHQQV
jgi:cytoskeletal protein CcmA (bactofilin family)